MTTQPNWQRQPDIVTVERSYVVAGFEPMRLFPRSPVQFVPDRVDIKIVDGDVRHPVISGGRLMKDGGVSTVSRHHRNMWDGDEWPGWLVRLMTAEGLPVG